MISAVELVDVGRSFGPSVDALHGVSLSVESGEFVAVTGRSGSGKSTLLNVLGLLDAGFSGRYFLFGQETNGLTERARSARRALTFGFVFQEAHLIPTRTTRENVELGLQYRRTPQRLRRAVVSEVLGSVSLLHRQDAFPSTMSGGERQRAVVARALANRPSILLCDEPTGSLDSHNAQAVIDLLLAAHQRGCTLIVVTHDAAIAALAQRRVTLHDGRVVEAASQ